MSPRRVCFHRDRCQRMRQIELSDEDISFLERLDFSNNRTSLLSVLAVMQRFSDSAHMISANQIIDMLSRVSVRGKVPSVNTMAGYISAMSEVPLFGFKVDVRQGAGARLLNDDLDETAMHHLINTIDTSRLMEREQKDTLKSGLGALFSKYQQEHPMTSLRLVADDVGMLNVMEHMDTVAEAMRERVKIEFVYGARNLDGTLSPLTDSEGKVATRLETPVNVFFARGYYYLETYPPDHPAELALPRLRFDRICSLRKTSLLGDPIDEYASSLRTSESQMRREVEALGGDNRTCFVILYPVRANQVFDQYGAVPYVETEDEEGRRMLIARLDVSVSNTFFRWLAGFQGEISLLDPTDLSDRQFRSLKHGELHDFATQDVYSEDYDALYKGYREFLIGDLRVIPELANELGISAKADDVANENGYPQKIG